MAIVSDLKYSDGIAAARTMLVLEGNAAALQRRLASGWELAPYAGDDLRGTSLRGANMLVPFHEVYAARSHDGQSAALPQVSYVVFVSQAREEATGEVAHLHWFTYTEDPAGVPGKYKDAELARVTRSQTFSKERRGETQVRESFERRRGYGGVISQRGARLCTAVALIRSPFGSLIKTPFASTLWPVYAWGRG